MHTLIIYDSSFGNTELLSLAIARESSKYNPTDTANIRESKIPDISGYDLLVVASPTQGGQPTKELQQFIHDTPDYVLEDKPVAVFDTRFAQKGHGVALGLLMKVIGFASPKLASMLREKGAEIIAEPEGFIVDSKEGPLAEGEVSRAKSWMASVVNTYKHTHTHAV